MNSGTALVPTPVARLNRGLLGLRVSLYAVVLFGLMEAGAAVWVLVAVASIVAVPAIRHPFLVNRRVHFGVATSIIVEFVLWYAYGPVLGLDFVPIVSVSVAALLLSRRAATLTWAGAMVSQAASILVAMMGGPPGAVLTGGVLIRREIVALVLIAMVGPAFRAIANVLSDLQTELAERVQAETRLTELVAEKDRFLEGAAHTLRTPLTGVLGLAQVVDAGGLDADEQRELVETIVAEGRRLVRAVDNVIVGSRLPMGRVEVLVRPISLAEAAMAASAGRATVEGAAEATGDPSRVVTVIGNLIDNAEIYGQDPITVTIWADDSRAWFEVADAGPGVPESVQESMFERYETRSHSLTQPASMGLGLPVSRELMRAMGGDLVCVGDGNRFRGSLPLWQVPDVV